MPKLKVGEVMKKAVSLVVIVLVIVSTFAGCVGGGYPLAIEGTRIPQGVYTYFLSQEKTPDKTLEVCKTLVASENIMKAEGISLSANYKRVVAEETDKKWSMFSAYYESIGVTKQDITSALTLEYGKKELLDFFYGDKGKKPLKDSRLRSEFDKTYVGFKAIEASYIKLSDMGESVTLSDREKSAIRKQFTSMAQSINSGTMTIDRANEKYNESIGLIVTQTLDTVLVKKGNVLYDDSFFSSIAKLGKGKAAVIESGNSVFLLQRQAIANEDEYFYLYKSEMLEKLKMDDIEKKLLKESAGYNVKTNNSLIKDIEDTVNPK